MDCKTYPLNTKEIEVLKKALKEDLHKRYIQHGSSSYVLPIFFIHKEDGKELHMVIDYRKLNNVMIKDFYPLLNLWEELERLSTHHLFSKFNIRAGYNNIQIEDKDQYKAAFKTPLSTYISMVMTFGFYNAPAIFQCAINQDLAELKQKYPDHFANYMDNIAIGTNDNIEGRRLYHQIINEFLTILKKHFYYLKALKCAFKQKQIEFLGFLLGQGTVCVDSSKRSRLETWPRDLHNIKKVQQILGVLGYQWAFIANYAAKAKPLHMLLKRNTPFSWTVEHWAALEQLIQDIIKDPILTAPDPDKSFELETDASTYTVEAVLFQHNWCGKRKALGYASKTLNAIEQNYNVWDREFLALIFRLMYWRHLLSGTRHPVQVFIDHVNLLHYRHPQKVNRRVAWYILTLADYNIQIQHQPEAQNRADPLSRRPDYDKGKKDNKEVMPLFTKLFDATLRSTFLCNDITFHQQQEATQLEAIKEEHGLVFNLGIWENQGKVVILSRQEQQKVLKETHDHVLLGHPGMASTYFAMQRNFWWPGLQNFVHNYVKGYATCLQNKADHQKKKPPLLPITPVKNAAPFATIGMDWITKLSPSQDYDAILTITDHDCSKAIIFIPCTEWMGTEDLAKLYFHYVFPFFGLPSKIISDWDTHLTSTLAWQICQ